MSKSSGSQKIPAVFFESVAKELKAMKEPQNNELQTMNYRAIIIPLNSEVVLNAFVL